MTNEKEVRRAMEIDIKNIKAGRKGDRRTTNKMKVLRVLNENTYIKSLNDIKAMTTSEVSEISGVKPINQVNQLLYRLAEDQQVIWLKDSNKNIWISWRQVAPSLEILKALEQLGLNVPEWYKRAVEDNEKERKEKKEKANNN